MALYRLGEAELQANGQVIGKGTNWQDQLALIRVGATIVFLSGSTPVLATISAIKSPTELTVIENDNQTAAMGKYVILLHDSITVEGLAQDVAETLRYYQSQETEIADAVDYFRTFDLVKFEKIATQVKTDATSAKTSATNAKTSETNAKTSETNSAASAKVSTDQAAASKSSADSAAASKAAAAQSETNAKDFAASASLSASAAKGSEDKVAADASTASKAAAAALASQTAAKTSETNSKASETNAKASQDKSATSALAAAGSASAAKTSETNAKSSETKSAASATTATQQADRAKTIADSIDPTKLLARDQNLADVPDKTAARKNLVIDRFEQQGETRTVIRAGSDFSTAAYLQLDANGRWGNYNPSTGWVALGIEQGGTGSRDAAGARTNLGVPGRTEVGMSPTGDINQQDANNLQYNGFFAAAGASGVNYANNYAPGLVMRRVNDVYQAQLDSNGRWVARSFTGGSWSQWNRSMLEGDYGVGAQLSLRPTTTRNCFMSDAQGTNTWAPANGAGFQSAYDQYRLCQFWITTSNAAYIRYNDSGNAQADKTSKPWIRLQDSGVSDERIKDVMGNLNVEASLDNISRLEFKLFKYKFDEPSRSARRGIIAQQAMTVDREYVHSSDEAGVMSLDSNPLLMDSMAAIKALKARDDSKDKRISDLEAEIAELKEIVKSLIAK